MNSLLSIIFAASSGFANDSAPFQCLQPALDTAMAHHQYTWGNVAYKPDIEETVEIGKKRTIDQDGQSVENFSFKITQKHRQGFINVRVIFVQYLENSHDIEPTSETCIMLRTIDYGLIESKIFRYRPN